ncbi:glycosyltransferase [Massilia rubra]|uniref:Glycosyltransferase family 1 protein n=1 Tax=Massilia rubra TaxID=2607910 RepID=A0ABX0LMW2_9BURK|nr:glycosyltransferase [Massilia rubra]NHZ35999.1 glycosyltransferase family 1 protein [Massilia rubra]
MSDYSTVLPHIVVVTTGSAGDLFPFLRLGIGLRERGHKVTILAPQMHEPLVRHAGLECHPLPADPVVLDDPDLWHPRRGFGVVWRAIRDGMEAMRAFVAALPPDQPCTLLVHPLAVAHADLRRAERPDIRIVAAYLAPSNLRTVHDLPVLGPFPIPGWLPLTVRRWLWNMVESTAINPVVVPELNAIRRAQGRAPISSYMDEMYSAPDLSVTLFPEWFGARQPDWPSPLLCGDFPLYDPHPEASIAPGLVQFMRAGSAPIIVTHGTANMHAAAFFASALAAAERLGRRIVFLTAHRAHVPANLPPTAFWQDYCPLAALLPDAAALVHHGGIGTTAVALRAGTPQLVVPMAYDQFDNGERVRAMHAGLTLKANRVSVRTLADALHSLLQSPEIHIGCSAVKERLAAGAGLDAVIDAISKTVSKTGKI